MKHYGLLILIVTAFITLTSAQEKSDIVVAEFGRHTITLDEFEDAYAKSVGGVEAAADDSLQQYEDFLDLYINFRMKLRDAEVRAYPADEELIKEFEEYKKNIGRTFIVEKEVVEPALKQMYERQKYELRASHILVRNDTLSDSEAKSLAQDIINRINNGEDFEKLNHIYSADQSSKQRGGDIYYFTSGDVVPEFEDAIYNTTVGEVYPEPVKTRYGYHVAKVTEKRERVPEVKVSHILVAFMRDGGKIDSAKAYELIKEAQDSLNSGVPFEKVAEQFSEDPGSESRGGNIGFIPRRRTVLPFDEAAFNLEPGEVSDIITTRFGYHILKVEEHKPLPGYEEVKEKLKERYQKLRYRHDFALYLDSLKTEEYNLEINHELISKVGARQDTLKVNGEYWQSGIQKDLGGEKLFTLADKDYTLDSLMTGIQFNPEFRDEILTVGKLTDALTYYAEEKVIQEKIANLEKDNEAFADLMQDYKNGIYIFKLQEEEIWNELETDSTKLRNYYEQHKDEYKFPDRVNYSEIHVEDKGKLIEVQAKLADGANFDTLAVEYKPHQYTPHTESRGFVVRTSSKLAEAAYELENKGDISDPVSIHEGLSIVRLNDKEASRVKTFEEARTEIVSDYQESESKRLEDKYLAELTKRYEPELYYEELEKAFK